MEPRRRYLKAAIMIMGILVWSLSFPLMEPGLASEGGTKKICSFLGDDPKPSILDQDLFKFQGIKGERVTITLGRDFSGTPAGGQATLSLFDEITRTWFFRTTTGLLPRTITAALPATGKYLILVAELPRLPRLASFRGAYCLTLASSKGAYLTILPTPWVEPPAGNRAPVANAGPDQTVLWGTQVNLDGSKSTDADSDPLIYKWSMVSMPAGSVASLSNPSTVNPTFSVDKPGTYVAQLIVNDGKVDSAPDQVIINTQNNKPIANAGPDQTVLVSTTATLDGSQSSDVDGDPLVFRWSFNTRPNGSNATLLNPADVKPTFVVDKPGTYVVQLIVTDGKEDSAPDQVKISTLNSKPVANAGPDQSSYLGANVILDGSQSNDIDGDLLIYKWSFASIPSGSAVTFPDPSSVKPTFVVDKPGTYIVQLIVNDGKEDSAPDQVIISTLNSKPVANAGPDQSKYVGDLVQLDGSQSSDVDGDLLTFRWSFTSKPSGSNANLSNPADVKPTFVLDVPGTYVVQLIVNDGNLDSGPDTVSIGLKNSKPVANAGPDQSTYVGDLVQLDGSQSSDVDGDPLTFHWSFKSRPAGSTAVLSNDSDVKPTFVLDKAGNYVVQLIVNDGKEDSAPATVTISTLNSRPVANAGPDQTVFRTDTVYLDGSGSRDADNDPLTYQWSFTSQPGGSQAVLSDPFAQNPTFMGDKIGLFVAQLIVQDGTLASNPDTVSITVNPSNVFVPDVVGLPQSGAESLLLSAYLNVGAVVKVYHVSVPIGYVISQNPRAGTSVTEGSAIDLTVSLGPALVIVPNIVGQTQEAANSAITGANLIVGTVTQANSVTVPKGNIISQDPIAGSSVIPGSAVSFVVSLGPALVIVPNIVGQTQEAANSAITGANLIVGTVTQTNSVTVPKGNIISQDPIAGSSVIPGSAVSFVVSLGPVMVTVPNVVGLTQTTANSAITGANLIVGTVTQASSTTVPAGRVITQDPSAGTSVSEGSSIALVISSGPAGPVLPPDPATVAPAIDYTVATTLYDSTAFLYTGSNPIQTGVAPGVIDPKRAAVVRGKILTRSGDPLPGVAISILNHPEFGQTMSRANGMYDLALNGGGPLTLTYAKTGLLPAQRTVRVPWQDWLVVGDVVLIERDSAYTNINTALNMYQVHQATPVTDSDGSRRSTILFPPGTTATLEGGATLSQFTVRATEFTVGPQGPKAMPAPLPPSSAYTFAVNLSLDEVGENQTVNFNQPVQFYVENFIGFPVGTRVPTGYYDPAKAAWIGIADGRVIKIVAEAAGIAQVDTDGDGLADNTGMSNEERTLLASLYETNAELWRVQLNHFSSLDMNYPSSPGPGAVKPEPFNVDIANNEQPSSGPIPGFGVLNPDNQTMTETIDLVGIPLKLHYASQRVPDGLRGISIPLTGATLPPELLKIYLNINIGGRTFANALDPQPNLVYEFLWDGLDAYGRRTNGAQPITVQVGYEYPNYYYTPWGQIQANEVVPSFARLGIIPYNIRARATSVLWSEPTTYIGKPKSVGTLDPRGTGLGGWTLSAHHAYDPQRRLLYMGDGSVREGMQGFGGVKHVAGSGEPGYSGDDGPAKKARLTRVNGLAVAPDGSLYLSGWNEVRRVDARTEKITTVAGGADPGSGGDGGPATAAQLSWPTGLSLGPDGSLYIVDSGNCRIRRIDPQGIITTVAGDTCLGEKGDNGPATAATIGSPKDVEVAPDGSFYISTESTYGGIRHVGTDGIITSLNAHDSWGNPLNGRIALGPDGSLYVAFRNGEPRVFKIRPDGAVVVVAGNGNQGNSGEGGPAVLAELEGPTDVAVSPDGVVYIVDSPVGAYDFFNRIVRVGTDGIISTVIPMGGNLTIPEADKGAPDVDLYLTVIASGPDGGLYFAQNNPSWSVAVGRLQPALPGFDGSEFIFPSSQGDLLHVFNPFGKHLETRNALTNALLLSFSYDSEGRLSQMTDSDGNITRIERDGAGHPTGLVGPYGQRTTLAINDDGWLNQVISPGGSSWQFSYGGPGGLLTQVITPRNSTYRFEYSSRGYLTKAIDAGNAETRLSRLKTANSYDVSVTSPGGIATVYRTEYLPSGEERHTTLFADGLRQETIKFPNFKRQQIGPDGTETIVALGPDPRFGMQAAYVKKATTTRPSGPTNVAELSRTVMLADPDNLFSLQQLNEISTLNGKTSSASYEAATRTFTLTSAAGRQEISQMDPAGRIVNAQSGGLEPTAFSYDSRGHLSQVSQGGRIMRYTHGTDGLLLEMKDSLNRTARFEYNPDGRIIKQWLPDGRNIGYTYDAGGLPMTVNPPAGNGFSFTWTPLGLPDVTTLPDGQTTDMDYNLDRQITAQRLPGSTMNLGYDALGRLSTLDMGGGAVITTSYGADGRPAVLSVPGQNHAFTWAGGLLTAESWTGLVNGAVNSTFDSFLRRARLTVSGSDPVEFTYDNDGLYTGAGTLVITRHPVNRWVTQTQLGGVSDVRGYNGFDELTSYTASFSGSPLYEAAFMRDDLGRIIQKTETIGGITRNYNFNYDAAGRLIGYSINNTPADSYVYDVRDNRTNAGGVDAAYDVGDRLISQGSKQCSYDTDGRLASETTGGLSTIYSYNPLGWLLSVDPPGPDNTVSYDYDGVGRRIRRSENGTTTNRWIFQDGLRPAAELGEDGNVATLFVYSNNLIAPDYMVRWGVNYRFIKDERGSVRLVVNTDTGEVAQQIDYDPWGRVSTDTNPGFQPFGFAGGLYDSTTGLVRFGMRDYDPSAGRFTAPDPVSLDGGQFNLYAYVCNDPVNWTDPSGLGAEEFKWFPKIMGGLGPLFDPEKLKNYYANLSPPGSVPPIEEPIGGTPEITWKFDKTIFSQDSQTLLAKGKQAANQSENVEKVVKEVKENEGLIEKIIKLGKGLARIWGNRFTTIVIVPTPLLDPNNFSHNKKEWD